MIAPTDSIDRLFRNKKSPRQTASGTNKQYPRYHPNYLKRDLFTLQQALSLNAGLRVALLRLPFTPPTRESDHPFHPHRFSPATGSLRGYLKERIFRQSLFPILVTFKHRITGLSTIFCVCKKFFVLAPKTFDFWARTC